MIERFWLDLQWWWYEQKGRRDVAVLLVWTLFIGAIAVIALA